MKRFGKLVLERFGLQVLRRPTRGGFPVDFEPEAIAAIRAAEGFTMTTPERRYALHSAVRYVVKNNIPGVFVECGVWRGGSVMVMATTLLQLNCLTRSIYLFDTFAGMPDPTPVDVDYEGRSQHTDWSTSDSNPKVNPAAGISVAQVQQAVYSTGYPRQQFSFVCGPVEQTLPERAPEQIAILRLDTDWYESTRHELVHLFPRVVRGGVLIVDDYGHFRGARRATDEYFAEHGISMFLGRPDYSGRIGIRL
jgi:hypothetical protein